MEDFRETLQQYFDQRKLANPAYSLNAYARDLDLYPSHLHEILNGRKGLSAATAKRIAFRLFDREDERNLFIDRVLAECSRAGTEKDRAKRRLVNQRQLVHEELSAEMFAIIKDWYHFALREYVRAQGARFKPEEAARYFHIPVKAVRDSLESMAATGLVKRGRSGKWVASEPTSHAPVGVPSVAKKMHHLQLLQIGREAYMHQDFHKRDYMSSILAIDSSKMAEAKKLIREFHEKINKLMSATGKTDQVYAFVTQLFSLEKGGEAD